MDMHFTDSHAHLSSMDDIDALIARALAATVGSIINVCSDIKSLQKGEEVKRQFPFLLNAGATSPHDVEKDGERDFSIFASFAKSNKLVAVGEIGLDYFYKNSSVKMQRIFLIRYFQLAVDSALPVILHCRDAFHDLFSISDDYFRHNNGWGRGVIHCFTGKSADLEAALLRGWLISFSGIITYPKNEELRQIVKNTPINSILIESDSPYLAPQKYRGNQNEPAYIVETAKVIADIKELPLEVIASKTSQNAKLLFK